MEGIIIYNVKYEENAITDNSGRVLRKKRG